MIIDEKGKVFGKISIIDLTVIIVVILAILGGSLIFGLSLSNKDDNKKLNLVEEGDILNEYMLECSLKNVRDITRDALSVGEEVFSVENRKPIGIIEKIESTPLQEIVTGVDGTMIYADIPEKYDVTLYIRFWGAETETGCFTEYNLHIGNGDSLPIKTVKVQTTPSVKNITLIPGKTKVADDPLKEKEAGVDTKKMTSQPETETKASDSSDVAKKENN